MTRFPRLLGLLLVLLLLSVLSSAAEAAELQALEPSDPETSRSAPQEKDIPEPPEGLRFRDTGPLRIRDQLLLSAGFLSFDPVSADVLPRGRWQVDVIFNVTNNFAHSEEVQEFLETRESRAPLTLDQLRAIEPESGKGILFVDGELYRSVLAVRRGLTDRLQLEIVVPVLNFQGGFADDLVENFHDTFWLGQGGRLGVERDSFTAYLRSDRGELFVDRQAQVALGDVILAAKLALTDPTPNWHLATDVRLKLPTGDDDQLYGSGSLDFGAQVLATRYFGRSCVHLGASVSYLGKAKQLNLDSQVRLSLMAGYEHAIGSSLSLIAQGTVAQSPFAQLDVTALAELTYLVDLGIKKGFGENRVLFFAITENLVNLDNTPDVGLHMGLTHTF